MKARRHRQLQEEQGGREPAAEPQTSTFKYVCVFFFKKNVQYPANPFRTTYVGEPGPDLDHRLRHGRTAQAPRPYRQRVLRLLRAVCRPRHQQLARQDGQEVSVGNSRQNVRLF